MFERWSVARQAENKLKHFKFNNCKSQLNDMFVLVNWFKQVLKCIDLFRRHSVPTVPCLCNQALGIWMWKLFVSLIAVSIFILDSLFTNIILQIQYLLNLMGRDHRYPEKIFAQSIWPVLHVIILCIILLSPIHELWRPNNATEKSVIDSIPTNLSRELISMSGKCFPGANLYSRFRFRNKSLKMI